MEKSRHKPPSRIRYEKNNPVLSTRMPKEWIDEFKDLLKKLGLSRKDFMAIALEKMKVNYKNAHNAGYNKGHDEGLKLGHEKGRAEGYEKGKKEYGIWIYCYICDEPIYIAPNSEAHKEIIEYLNYRGYGHPKCHN